MDHLHCTTDKHQIEFWTENVQLVIAIYNFFCVRSYPLLYPPRTFCQFRTNFPASFGWGLKKLPQIPTLFASLLHP